jgi:hypothetical protein
MESKTMTLLQKTADTLVANNLCQNYHEFSTRFCKRTPNFFYRQRFHDRDFPTDALLECLFTLREENAAYDRFATIFETEVTLLGQLEDELAKTLIARWRLNPKRADYLVNCISDYF